MCASFRTRSLWICFFLLFFCCFKLWHQVAGSSLFQGVLLHVGFILVASSRPATAAARDRKNDSSPSANPQLSLVRHPLLFAPLSHFDWCEEWDMLIKRNEIDICINRSENTKGVRSFQVPRFAASHAQKKFILPSQWLLHPLKPPLPRIGRYFM